MKKSTIAWLLVFVSLSVVCLGGLTYLAHFGPLGVRAGDDVMCSELIQTNGPNFCIIAHRTGELIDAYHVFLYRIEQNGETYKYVLGYEDSFWWGSSLLPSEAGHEIEIRAFGKLVARYVFDTGSVMCVGENYPPEHGQKISNDAVQKLLSRQKR
jgi:hypothetical protein